MSIIRRHKLLAGFVVLAIVVTAGLAGAYWTSGGLGTGSASTGTTVSIVVHQTSAAANLYPGGPAAGLNGNFDNPNVGPVFVTGVTAVVDPTFTSQADGTKPACVPSDFTIGGAAPVGAEIVSGNGVGAWGGLTIAMIDKGTNQDNCKNVIVPINYTAS